MQRSNIEWVVNPDGSQGFTSNPIRGRCLHACSYCYAEAIRKRFKQSAEKSWHPKELEAIERRKKPATIFIGSMYDIFGEWVPDAWILQILITAQECPRHKFIFLTKNPGRYAQYNFSDNCYIGYSDDGTKDLRNWAYFKHAKNTFVSLEPLLGNKINLNLDYIDGIIIGAQTNPTVAPHRQWIDDIVRFAKPYGVKIFIKDNLVKIYPGLKGYRDLAWDKA